MKILIDPYHLHQPVRGEFVVDNESSFRQARSILLGNLLNGHSDFDTIHVFEKPYVTWFNDVPDWAEIITPRSMMSEKFAGVKIPVDLSDEAIFSLGLLDLDVAPSVQAIWRHFFQIEMPSEPLTLSGLYELAQTALARRISLNNSYLAGLWRSRLKELAGVSSKLIAQMVIPLANAEGTYALALAEGIYTAKNKPYFEKWTHEHNLFFHEYGINVPQFAQLLADNRIELPSDSRFEKNLLRFLLEQFKLGLVTLDDLSGDYQAEIEAVINLKKPLTLAEHGDLSERFSGKLTGIQQQSLFLLCVPTYTQPAMPDGLTLVQQTEHWKNWAVDCFIPFKFYYDEAAEPGAEILELIEEGSLAYSDWFFENYRSIISNAEIPSNFDVTRKIRSLVDERGTKVIWLIIDGFPAYFTQTLRGILKAHGINQVESAWNLATLPTITELGIPLMLSGSYQTATSDTEGSSRLKLLNKALNPYNCYYTTKISDFQAVLQGHYDVCCIHTHEIDTLLHQNDADFDTSRAAAIAEILEKRINTIAAVIRESADQKIKLVISTDHGATKCLSKGQHIRNIRLDEAVKTNPRERCVALSGKLEREQIDPEEMYLLKKESAQTWDDWAIARGYHYFGRHDSGYRHGGLSPEETIVPMLVCGISSAREASLQLRYTGLRELPFGKTEKEFRMKISNNGGASVEILQLSIDEDLNCIFKLPVNIAPDADTTLMAAIKLPQKLQTNAKGGKLVLHLKLICLILGERVHQELTCSVPTAKDEFEDDFDF